MAEDGDPERDINATGDEALTYVGGEISIEMELPKILWMKRHLPDHHASVVRYHDLAELLRAFAAQALTQNIKVKVAGDAYAVLWEIACHDLR